MASHFQKNPLRDPVYHWRPQIYEMYQIGYLINSFCNLIRKIKRIKFSRWAIDPINPLRVQNLPTSYRTYWHLHWDPIILPKLLIIHDSNSTWIHWLYVIKISQFICNEPACARLCSKKILREPFRLPTIPHKNCFNQEQEIEALICVTSKERGKHFFCTSASQVKADMAFHKWPFSINL